MKIIRPREIVWTLASVNGAGAVVWIVNRNDDVASTQTGMVLTFVTAFVVTVVSAFAYATVGAAAVTLGERFMEWFTRPAPKHARRRR